MEQLNLKLTLNENGSITANWSRITGAVRYHAYIAIGGTGYAAYNKENLTTTSFTTDPGLEVSKQYKAVVIAYNSAGMSITSDGESVYIYYDFYNKTPLEVPQKIKAVPGTVDVVISFDEVDRASSYDILVGDKEYNTTNRTKKITGLQPKTRYTYAVRAKNPSKTGAYSATQTFTTLPISPAIPSNIKKSVTENTATISWGTVKGAISYDIVFNGFTYRVTEASKTITGLTAGTSYTFQIRANNADASSSYGNTITVTTTPKPPTNVSATSNEDSIIVSWSPSVGAVNYYVKLNGEEILTLGSPSSFTGLKPNTTYTYQVCARSADGTGSYTAEKKIMTSPRPPEFPKVVTTKDSVTLSWSAVTGATSYDVLFDDTTYRVTGTFKTISGLDSGESYSYSIRSNNADGSSSYTATNTITTILSPPGVPKNVIISVTPDSVTLSWDPVPKATSYDVIFDGTTYRVSGTTKTITELTPDTGHTYSVRANNSAGSGSYTDSKPVKTPIRPPAVPKDPSTSTTTDSITLSWDAVSGATGYDVMFDGKEYSVTGTSRTFTGLSQNKSYTYAIRSKNAGGASEYSDTKTIQTLPVPPSTPTNVSVDVTADSVEISWNPVSGATSYDVVFDGKTYRVTDTTKTITGLTPTTNYSYSVRANNAGGSSAYTASRTVQTPGIIPAVPSNVEATATVNSVMISWDAVAGAARYMILFNGTAYDVSGTSRTFTGLMQNTNYSYSVRARNSAGMSDYSAEKTVRTLPYPPNVPTNITASATANSVTVNWNAQTDATSYDIIFGGTTYNVTSNSKTITGLTQNTNYTYSVRANNAGGSSAYAYAKTITTLAVPPAVPTILSAVSTADTVTISWSPVAGATSYDVLFNSKTYSFTSTSWTFNILTSDTSYTYAVCAKNSAGKSAYTATRSIRTRLFPPSGINATATTNTVTVSWYAETGATSYDILLNNTVYNTKSASRTITGLTPGTIYAYSVRTNGTGGVGEYSNTYKIQTTPNPPAVPTNINAIPKADYVTVSWNSVKDATGYEVLIDGKTYVLYDSPISIGGLTPNTNYTYQVRAKNRGGTSAYSAAKTVRTLLRTPENINTVIGVKEITVGWNPVAGATGYDIIFNGGTYSVTDAFKEFTGLTEDSNYTFAVRAKNSVVYSDYSRTYQVTTQVNIPAIPSNVNANSTLNSVSVSWNPVKGATSYDVDFDGEIYNVRAAESPSMLMTARSTRNNVSQNNGSKTNKKFTGLMPGTKHPYCVRANNERGSSDYSETKTARTKLSKRSGLPNARPNKTYPDGKAAHMGLDPVNALTGSFLWSYTYLEDFGKDALHFTAMYDSQRDEYPKALGSKWTYSLNYLLYMGEEYAFFSTPYDEVIPFLKNTEDGSFQLAEGIQSDYTMGRKEDQSYFVKDLGGAEYVFDSTLRLSRIESSGLTSYRFQADKDGKITRIEGGHGASLALEYTEGHISSVTDTMGNSVSFTYEDNYLVSAVNPDGNGMTFIYDESGNLLEITDFSGKSHLINRYDDQDRVVEQNTAGRGNSYAAYDETNRVTTFTDELGNATKYHYDEELQVTDIELGGINLQSKYNEKGQLVEQIDALGNSTQMTYDEKGRMNHVVYPDKTEEYVTYNDRNYPVKMVNRDGTEVFYEYDTRNNLISVKDECGNVSSYFYDDVDNLISYMDRNGTIWTCSYDANNHLAQAEDPEGNVYKYSHDAIGRLLSYTSPTESTTTYQYSETGNLIRIVDEDGTIAFDYDMNGNNTGLMDRMGNKQRLEYNEMGQVSLATDFMGNEYTFSYDEAGKLIKETDPLGYSQSYVYDAMGNNTARTDQNGGTTNYSFDAAGQLTEVKDAAGNLTKYTYDTMGQVKTVTDVLNYQTNYVYDVMGRLTSVTNAVGQSVSYTYDRNGNLLTKTDESGAVIEYIYDNESRLLSSKSDAGITRFTYDKLGRLISVEDTEGYSEKVLYDGDGNVTEFSDKESGKRLYVYDRSGRITEETDSNGNKTSYTYDPNGNCIGIRDAEGNEYSYEYDANNRMIKEKDPLGNETSYEYDVRGNQISVSDAKGGKTAFEYDGNGNLIKEVNPASGVTIYSYDKLDRLTETVDAEGNRRSFSYDAAGNMTSYTDANRNEWAYEYDAINRLTEVTDQDGGSMTFSYTKSGKIEKVTDPEGAETNYRYDSMDRLVEMSDALKNSLSYTYDSLGRVLTQTDAGGNTTEYEYSPSGNLLRVKDPEGSTVAYTYDALGQVLTETDALGSIISYEYDSLGQVMSITDAGGAKTSFTYTANGEIATVTDANGGVTRYQYDACGNLSQLVDPLGNTMVYEYDAMNNQIKECLSISQEQTCVTIYQYDKKGRIVREINPMSDEKVYTYDGNGNIVSILDEDKNETTVRYDLNNKPVSMRYSDGREAGFRYNKRGELVELKDWNGTVNMEYGRTGRLAKVTDHNGRSTGYGYDANGNITSIDYPDGSVVNYTYDKNNRMTKVMDAGQQITNYEYNPVGNVLSIRQPGSTSSYTYNAKGLPAQVKYQLTDGTFMENSFTYDKIGNIVSSDRKGSSLELTGSSAYTYDALGQLLTYKEGLVTEAYGYDALGNRIFKKVDGRQEASYQYNVCNQLISRTEKGIPYSYGYDKRGNLTEESCAGKPLKKYIYDATGHMSIGRNLENGEKTQYFYNALYMRVKNVQTRENRPSGYRGYVGQTDENSLQPFKTREISYVTDYLSGVNNELISYEKDYGETKAAYGRGYECLSRKISLLPESLRTAKGNIASESKGTAYFQADILGSSLFAANEQGGALRYAKRDAWGDLRLPAEGDLNLAGVEDGMRFTNYSYDPVIDKYFAQARFYDSRQGRMLGTDPVRRGMNGYPYCRSNPANRVDPTGEIVRGLVGFGGGFVFGGASGFADSVLSQISDGGQFSLRKAFGAAVNAGIVSGTRGALITTGAGLIPGTGKAISLAADFAAGTVGNALEQMINGEEVDWKESLASGLTNTISGKIYGNTPLKSGRSAFRKGAKAGGASAVIENLLGAWNSHDTDYEPLRSGNPVASSHGAIGGSLGASPNMRMRDPKAGCGTPSPFSSRIGYGNVYGYQYGERPRVSGTTETKRTKKGGIDLLDFVTDVGLKSLTAGLGSVGFYGLGKKAGIFGNSIRKAFGNKGGSNFVETPYGKAYQDSSKKALNVKKYVENGGDIYRGGTLGRSKTTDAQFWAAESPLSPGYANKYGVDFNNLDYIMQGKVKPGTNFITRPAPGLGNNAGGGIEIVTPPNSVDFDYFHMIGGGH